MEPSIEHHGFSTEYRNGCNGKAEGDRRRIKHSIMFVDDDELLLDCWDDLFSYIGHSVYKAANRSRAAGIFLENKEDIDIVVIDVNFGQISGFEVYSDFVRMDSRVAVLFTSAELEMPQGLYLTDGTKPHFLSKPFDVSEALEKFDEVVLDKQNKCDSIQNNNRRASSM